MTQHEADDDGPSMADILQDRLDAVSTREEKMAILEEYMSPSQAVTAIGFIMDERTGDLIDITQLTPEERAELGYPL